MAKNLVDSIQMEVRSKQPCRKELDFTVPADAVKSETDKVLREFAYAVSIPRSSSSRSVIFLLRSSIFRYSPCLDVSFPVQTV